MRSVFSIGRAPCGLRAHLLGEVPVGGRFEGRRWRFAVSDGIRGGEIEADLPRSGSRGPTPGRRELEGAIEALAGHFAIEYRLDEMLAEYRRRGPFAMSVDDLGLQARRSGQLRDAA